MGFMRFVIVLLVTARSDRSIDLDGEIERIRTHLSRDDMNDSSNTLLRAALWRDLGALYQAKGIEDFIGDETNVYESDALNAFSNSIELNSQSDMGLAHDAWLRKGLTYELIGRTEDAADCHDKAYAHAQNGEQRARALHNKGNAVMMAGKVDEALKLYRRSLRLQRSPACYLSLVKAYLEKSAPDSQWRKLSQEIEGELERVGASPDSASLYWAAFHVGGLLCTSLSV
jgi:tetratricopeptide (TPR) repeat protein